MKTIKKKKEKDPVAEILKQDSNFEKFKKVIIGVIVLFCVGIVVAICLNLDRIPYAFGKKDPIATVDSQPITTDELKASLLATNMSYAQLLNGKTLWGDSTDPNADSTQSDTIDSIAQSKIEFKKAKAAGITLTASEKKAADAEAEKTISGYTTNQNEAYQSALNVLGISGETFTKQCKESYETQAVISKYEKVLIDDYKKTLTKKDLERIKLRQIYFTFAKHKPAVCKQMIDDVIAKFKAGQSFITLAKQYNDDADTKKSGGDLGTDARADLPAMFSVPAFATKAGDVSKPFKSKIGYHVLYVEKRWYLDLDHLADSDRNYIIGTDAFKKYYEKLTNKWKKSANIRKYITSIKLDLSQMQSSSSAGSTGSADGTSSGS